MRIVGTLSLLKLFLAASMLAILGITAILVARTWVGVDFFGQAATPSTNEAFERLAGLNPFGTSLKGEDEGRVNFLLLGISGEEYISGDLTDSIMLLSLDTKNRQVHLFSIPRDLWVKHGEHFTKINELYRAGGGTEAPAASATGLMRQKVEEITGLSVHYTSVVNLEAVREVVDTVEGVDVDGEYLDGAAALWYVRDRSTPRADFDRMERQQKLLGAVRAKLMHGHDHGESTQWEELMVFGNALANNMSTDASLLELYTLYRMSSSVSEGGIHLRSITPAERNLLTSEYTDINGARVYTLRPTAGPENYSAIRAHIAEQLLLAAAHSEGSPH
ncbi:MAG: LCP family protein [Candidatus Spechtbacterales bacterium]